MSYNTVKTIDISPTLRIRIEYDTESESPADCYNLGKITYRSGARNVLGTEAIDTERFEEIARGIENGTLIGLPVYAYVHSGSTIATTPFHCQWDSGRSGWVYCTREAAVKEFGKKVCTAAVKEKAMKCLRGEVDTFDQYLRGEVYGYIVERAVIDEDGDKDWERLDSCWGHYGLDYCIEQGRAAAAHYKEEVAA